MKGMLIPTNGNPVEIDIEVDEAGSTLHDLQRLVGGNIEPFDVIFGEASASTSMRRACSPARPTARCTRPRAWKRPGTSP